MCILEQHSVIMFLKIYIKNICYKSHSVLLLSLMFLRSMYLQYLKDIYIFALLLRATLVAFEKSSSDEKPSLWGGGRGCQEKKGTYNLGQLHWQWSSPQLAIFNMHVFSLVTFIFFPTPRVWSSSCPLLEFAGFTMWYYFFLSVGYFSIWMWRKAICDWLLLFSIVQNKKSKRKIYIYQCFWSLHSILLIENMLHFIHFLIDGVFDCHDFHP